MNDIEKQIKEFLNSERCEILMKNAIKTDFICNLLDVDCSFIPRGFQRVIKLKRIEHLYKAQYDEGYKCKDENNIK